MKRALPLFKAKIKDTTDGMFCISLVDDPATQSMFQKFSEDKELLKFKVENEEKRIVRGLVMAADMPIYRRNGDFEYYISYEPETIRKMAENYLFNGFQNYVDTMHNNEFEDSINMVQFFIKDVEMGINPKGFEQYADGSLFTEFHVLNDDVWSKIKDGTFKGFSLEGFFDIEETDDTVEEVFKNEEMFTDDELEDIDERDIMLILDMANKLRKKIKNIR